LRPSIGPATLPALHALLTPPCLRPTAAAPAGDEVVAWLTLVLGAPALITNNRSTAKALSRAERARGWLNIEASFTW